MSLKKKLLNSVQIKYFGNIYTYIYDAVYDVIYFDNQQMSYAEFEEAVDCKLGEVL
ncbi:hypothetical protein Cassandra_0351 [Pseudomonas phage Cassandra]|nr:hypothetical protein Cassandra_0351 [Pseudomonas phage Cassandra]WPK40578.1 hypothetical protein Paride_0348 [Pseudomonas phage Paride]